MKANSPLSLPPVRLLNGGTSLGLGDPFALWRTEDYDWAGRPPVYGGTLPLCWTRESLNRLLADFPDKQDEVEIRTPSPAYGATFTPITPPRCVLYVGSGLLLGALGKAAEQLRSQLDLHNVHVMQGDRSTQGAFILAGMPPTSSSPLDGPDDSGGLVRIVWGVDPGAFAGGEVLVIADADQVGSDVYYYRRIVDDGSGGLIAEPRYTAWQSSIDNDNEVAPPAWDSFARYKVEVVNFLQSDLDPDFQELNTTSDTIVHGIIAGLPAEHYALTTPSEPIATLEDLDAMAAKYATTVADMIAAFFGF